MARVSPGSGRNGSVLGLEAYEALNEAQSEVAPDPRIIDLTAKSDQRWGRAGSVRISAQTLPGELLFGTPCPRGSHPRRAEPRRCGTVNGADSRLHHGKRRGQRVNAALSSGEWGTGVRYLNGLSMRDMLLVLDRLDRATRQTLADVRALYADGVNMLRIEYALFVVQTRSLPQVAPGDLATTGQVEAARSFLQQRTGRSGAGLGGSPSTSAPLAPGQRRAVPTGYRPARRPTPAVVAKANELLRSSHPIGTHNPLTVDGQDYLFAVEWHKHAPTDPVPERLIQWHRGITVYEKSG